MSNQAQTGRRTGRAFNLLRSINEGAGRPLGAYISEGRSRGVPARLSEAIARTALVMLQEARKPMSDEELEAARAKRMQAKAGRNEKQRNKARGKAAAERAAGKKPKKAALFKTKEGYEDEELDTTRRKLKIPDAEREELKKKDQERRAKKPKKAAAPKPPKGSGDGDDPRPPAPPEAPAQAAAGDGPTDARSEADKLKKIKSQLNKPKSRAKGPFDYAKGAAGLQQMRKRREQGKVGSGAEKESTIPSGSDSSVHDKIDALHQMIQDLTQHVTRSSDISTSVRRHTPTASRRWDSQLHPEDDISPEEFDQHQERRRADLDWHEKERLRRGKSRSLGAKGGPMRDYHSPGAHDRQGDFEPAALRSKVSKLRRERMKHPEARDRDHDTAKGHWIRKRERDDDTGHVRITDEHPEHKGDKGEDGKKKSSWAGHYKDPETGEVKHGSGDKDKAKFANATTFGATDDDAMLHTDKDKEGSRGSADDDEFALKGDTKKDPRQKWYRVSKEGGYASAMGSLRKAYGKGGDTKEKVLNKVQSTGFVDRKGHQIDVRPTGDLNTARGKCDGAKGEALTSRNPKEHYRLCKGSHDGPGGTKKGRSEYTQGFNPQHDDAKKLKARHASAEKGKKWSSRG